MTARPQEQPIRPADTAGPGPARREATFARAAAAMLLCALAGACVLAAGGCSGRDDPTVWSGATRRTDWLTLLEARELATRLANDAFARREFHDRRSKKTVTGVRLQPEDWQVERTRRRWEFKHTPDVGPQAEVSFDMYGNDPDVDVDYDFH